MSVSKRHFEKEDKFIAFEANETVDALIEEFGEEIKESLFCVRVFGDGMKPYIKDEEIVLVNQLSFEAEVDSVYMIESEGRYFIRRTVENEEGIIFKPDNVVPNIEQKQFFLKDVVVIGKVVGVAEQ